MSRVKIIMILAVFLSSSTGCTSTMNLRNAFTSTGRLFTPNSRDYDDGSDESGKEWDFVGDEGRAGQPRERDPDPWFKNMIMSEKARSIEHNLGID